MGSRVREGWPEVADFNDHVMKVGLAGGTLAYRDQELILHRSGKPEQVWMDLDYSPIPDEDGKPAGVIAIVIETTAKVLAERWQQGERDRQRQMFEQASGFMGMLVGPDHVFELTNAAYMQLVGHRDILGKPVREALPELVGQGFLELLDEVFSTGEPFIGSSLRAELQRTPGAPKEERFIDLVYQPVRSIGGEVIGIFVQGVDVTERLAAEQALRDSEAQLRMLAHELEHRIKNILAMVSAIATQTLRNSTIEAARQAFHERVRALATAHDILNTTRWTSASIRQVIEKSIAVFPAEQISIAGDSLSITPKMALSLALAVNELGTKAIKYGSLSTPSGGVAIDWWATSNGSDDEPQLRWRWREIGGPPVVTPTRRGFGSVLIQRVLADDFGGAVQIEYKSDGLECTLIAPLPTAEASHRSSN